jgi:hypothetical protein
MNQKRFATQFEAKLKPRIAKDLHVYPQGQCFSGDFLTPYGNIIEMKIRKIDDNEKSPGFIACKNQYEKIMGSLEMHWDINSVPRRPTFSYLFLPYSCKKSIKSVNSEDEIIEEMKISKAYIVDNKFVLDHDKSGEDSRFHKVMVKKLDENVLKKRNVKLLGSEVTLSIVGYDSYLTEMIAKMLG